MHINKFETKKQPWTIRRPQPSFNNKKKLELLIVELHELAPGQSQKQLALQLHICILGLRVIRPQSMSFILTKFLCSLQSMRAGHSKEIEQAANAGSPLKIPLPETLQLTNKNSREPTCYANDDEMQIHNFTRNSKKFTMIQLHKNGAHQDA